MCDCKGGFSSVPLLSQSFLGIKEEIRFQDAFALKTSTGLNNTELLARALIFFPQTIYCRQHRELQHLLGATSPLCHISLLPNPSSSPKLPIILGISQV